MSNIRPWIVTPRPRQYIDSIDDRLTIIIGGTFDLWENKIRIDDIPVLILSVERVTNYHGRTHPFTKLIVGDIDVGHHVIQLDNQQPMKFYKQ